MKKFDVAVNTRLLLPGRLEGISRFAFEVLQRMTTRNPEVNFLFLFDRAFDQQFVFGENVTPVALPPQARHPSLWYLWFHRVLPYYLNRKKPQVFFSPEFYLAPGFDGPKVPVFHDLAYEHHPYDIGRLQSLYCRHYSPRYAQIADHLLTVSEFSKADIVKTYGIDPNKISVVYNGASRQFQPLDAKAQQVVRDQYSDGKPFFHFVGTLHPRKNIDTLLQAFDIFKDQTTSAVKLLIVGRRGWQYEKAMDTYEQMVFKDDVLFTGYVPDEELGKIYASSLGLCYVPYLEGFGIPILEAMQCDTPVICSNVSSMPEVGGEAAILVPPFHVEKIAEGMRRLFSDPEFRAERIAEGQKQRKKFSWDRTYEKCWSVLRHYLA